MMEKPLEPTYDDFPSIEWEIGMDEMLMSYKNAIGQGKSHESALNWASVIYNSRRDHYLRGLWNLPVGRARELYEKRKLADARRHLRDMLAGREVMA